MFIFVCVTNILLITSLISLLSNSLTKVSKALEGSVRGEAHQQLPTTISRAT